MKVGRRSAIWLSVLATLVLTCALPGHSRAAATLTGPVLHPASPIVVPLGRHPQTGPIRLRDGLADWPGRISHIAGSAHYDRGEWIYEDYPYTAYGAAAPGIRQVMTVADGLASAVPPSQRIPGGLAEFVATTGAGPFLPEADLSQLRFAVRGRYAYVLARTTAMHAPVETALLLLFDTGHSGVMRTVPFGSGLHTDAADTAVLVTAAGTRIVDLATGATTRAPAAADPTGYVNTLQTRLPLRLIRRNSGSSVRFVGAAGVVSPGSFTLESRGKAGPIAKVVPRFDVPVQSVYERQQALALAKHDIDGFFTTVSVTRMRRGDSQRLEPGIGYTVRTFDSPARLSTESGTNGVLRDYGLYIPRGFNGKPIAATLLLRGSGMTAHSLAAVTPGLFQQLGDDDDAIIVSPGGRSDLDAWEGAAYHDADQALADAERILPIDRDRVDVAGYSMGGFGTYLFADTQPARFAAAFVIEGPVGGAQPATAGSFVNQFVNLIPLLSNVSLTPMEIYQGVNDTNVPITNGLSAAARLRGLGYRYQFNLFPGDHLDPGILNDYSVGAAYIRGRRRVVDPSRVRFTRDMLVEHRVDTGADGDAPLKGRPVGLRFDHAWWVSDLQAGNPRDGVASIDATTLARPRRTTTVVPELGMSPPDIGGAPPSVREALAWRATGPVMAKRNAFTAHLTGVSHVVLDLVGMGLTIHRPLTATITTDRRTVVVLRAPARRIVLRVAPGTHTIRVAAGAPPR